MRLKYVLLREYITVPGTEHDTMIVFEEPWQIDVAGHVVTLRHGDRVAVFPWNSVKQGVPEESAGRKAKG